MIQRSGEDARERKAVEELALAQPPPPPTASSRTKGIAVYAPPKVRSPALRPDRNKAVAVTDLINRE